MGFGQTWSFFYYIRNEIYVRRKYAKPSLRPIVPAIDPTEDIVGVIIFSVCKLARCKALFRVGVNGIRS